MTWISQYVPIGLILATGSYLVLTLGIMYWSPRECLEYITFNTTQEEYNATLALEQSNELCQSEGVDNTLITISSQFYVAVWAMILALHLSWCGATGGRLRRNTDDNNNDDGDDDVYKSSILFQIFMMGSFTLQGVATMMFPNSGADGDDHGMLGYWIIQMGSTIFFVTAGLCIAHFAMDVDDAGFGGSRTISPTTRCGCLVSGRFVVVCQLLLVIALSGVLLGGIWCTLSPEIQVDDVYDEFESRGSDDEPIHMCFNIYYWCSVVLQFCWSLLWIPAGGMLYLASKRLNAVVRRRQERQQSQRKSSTGSNASPQDSQTGKHRGGSSSSSSRSSTATTTTMIQTSVWGMPISWSALLVVIVQWTGGSMLIVYLALTAQIRREVMNAESYNTFLELWNGMYGSIIYHWSMIVTVICVHNVAYRLTIRTSRMRDNRNVDDMESYSVTRWWTWVTSGAMATWWWAEKKQPPNDNGKDDDDDDDSVYIDEDDGTKLNDANDSSEVRKNSSYNKTASGHPYSVVEDDHDDSASESDNDLESGR